MWKVNIKGRNKAITLINSDDIDFISPFSDNGENTIYLAVDSENKNQFQYPIACTHNNKLTLYKSGIENAKKDNNKIISDAADMLLEMINDKKKNDFEMECPECGCSFPVEDPVCPECGFNFMEEIPEEEMEMLTDKGEWWTCPSVWKKIWRARRKKGQTSDRWEAYWKKKKEEMKDVCGTAKKKKKEKTDSKDFQRYDLYDFDTDSWLEEKFKLTPDGYLTGRAIITNIGVFSYVNQDGTVRRELRLPEEVFARESLETLKSKPITNNHPSTIVSVDNVKDFQVGFTGDDIRTNPYHVSIPVTFTDKKTIDEDIKQNGKRAFSGGYLVNLDETPGVWLGVPYDAVQRNIRYNHVALVDRGRAGDAAKMKMDGMENSAYRLVGDSVKNIKEEDMPELLKKFTIDGVEYQAEGRVIETLNTEKKRADDLQVKFDTSEKALTDTKTKLSATEAERDTLKAKLDKAENDLKAAKLDDSKIKEAVDKRLNLLTAVYAVGVEVKSDETDEVIMKKVIAKAFPDVKLDGKDNVYIQGMFDGAIGILQKQGDNMNRKIFVQNNNDGTTVVSSETAKKNMLARISGAKK